MVSVSVSFSGVFSSVLSDASAFREAPVSVARFWERAPSYMRTAAAVTAEIRISRFVRFIDALAFLNGPV